MLRSSERGWIPLVLVGSFWVSVGQAQPPPHMPEQGAAEASSSEGDMPDAAAHGDPRSGDEAGDVRVAAQSGEAAQASETAQAAQAGQGSQAGESDEAAAGASMHPGPESAHEAESPAHETPSVLSAGSVSFSPRRGLRVAGDAGSFELHLAAWLRLDVASLDDTPAPHFAVPLARPLFRVRILDDRVSFLLQPELAGGNVRLLDLHIDVRIHDALRLRLGQFRTPYSRAYITPIVSLLLPTRGLVDDTFRLDRDTGLMVYGAAGDLFEYQVGVFNGARINTSFDAARAPMVVGRAVFNIGDVVPYDQVPSAIEPAGTGLALGVAGAFRKASPSETEPPTETAHVALEATLMAGPVTATAEAFHRNVHPSGESWFEEWGTFAQAGVFLVPGAWDASARVGWMRTGRDGDETLVLELGSAVYTWEPRLGHHLKLNLAYRFLRVDGATDVRDHALRAQLQLSM